MSENPAPIDLDGQIIYHCGPVMLKDEEGKWHVKAAGPTTSIREEPYRATIYLGHWALNYESSETAPNWEYQKINMNYYDNRGGDVPYRIRYVQENQKAVSGGLTAKIPKAEDVKKMMLLKATEKTHLPLAFETIVGAGTKKDEVYNVASNRIGYLSPVK